MKPIQKLFDEYSESHQHKVNKMIHWICVPLIYFSMISFIMLLRYQVTYLPTIILSSVITLYISWSQPIGIGMIAFTIFCVVFAAIIHKYSPIPLWKVALTIFILAWIGQFIGHQIEGKKPSFLKDLQFLLVGPAWLLNHILRKLQVEL